MAVFLQLETNNIHCKDNSVFSACFENGVIHNACVPLLRTQGGEV
jgi:hypothetical protein